DGNVFSPIKRSLETGGNDYWESGMAQPDLLLKDMISIFHPEVLPNHELIYYQRLN
ncbi:MAG: iron complex transport system substrate-binding protein, partial [Flavobacteriales bacterium]